MLFIVSFILGRWFTITFPQVPEKFFGHLASVIGCEVHSMRQVPHKKPPFYSASTKRVSYRTFNIAPFANALHEQDLVRLKESVVMCGREEVEGDESHNPVDELEAAKSRSHWNIQERSKRVDYKGELEVGPGEKRCTREIELVWWPELFPTTNHGKLVIRFFVKKVFI